MSVDKTIPETGLSETPFMNLSIMQSNADAVSLLNEVNANLTKPQKELLLWHQRLAHARFVWNQDLMRSSKEAVGSAGIPPFIPMKNTSTCRVTHPRCEACLFSKQHRRTPGSQTIVSKPEREMAIRRESQLPGDLTCGDQWISSQLGRLPHTHGKEPDDDRLRGGTLLVDAYSAHIYHHHQVSLRTGKTLVGKHAYERWARLRGVNIKKH